MARTHRCRSSIVCLEGQRTNARSPFRYLRVCLEGALTLRLICDWIAWTRCSKFQSLADGCRSLTLSHRLSLALRRFECRCEFRCTDRKDPFRPFPKNCLFYFLLKFCLLQCNVSKCRKPLDRIPTLLFHRLQKRWHTICLLEVCTPQLIIPTPKWWPLPWSNLRTTSCLTFRTWCGGRCLRPPLPSRCVFH